ncbi:MAG: hypothetical protein WCV81_05460 [Microgenomates group bacterium]|jgi:hypothetical protein
MEESNDAIQLSEAAVGVVPKEGNILSRKITKRSFLQFGGAGLAAAAATLFGVKIARNQVEKHSDELGFIAHRLPDAEPYLYKPSNPREMLSQQSSNELFKALKLEEQYPHTINPDAFYTVIQRPARLANWYFVPDQTKSKGEQEKDFTAHCEKFFGGMKKWADLMEIDFPAALLMFTISGDATATKNDYLRDITDEQIRMGVRIVGPSITDKMIGVLRQSGMQDNSTQLYGLARLEGMVTMGIHDMETVVIAQALKDLEKSLPQKWPEIAVQLKEQSSEFFAQYGAYLDQYTDFETQMDQVATTVQESPEVRAYLGKFFEEEKLKNILLAEDGSVDSYQFKRTTLFWANILDMNLKDNMSMFVKNQQDLEKYALDVTINGYLNSGSPNSFFLDQILNPKMIAELKKDADKGNQTAQQLLLMSQELGEAGEKIIATDSKLASTLVNSKTEKNVLFQLITGTAFARMLLRGAHNFTHKTNATKITYDSPNDLAYDVFLANGNREMSSTFLLSGKRPVNPAALPYLSQSQNLHGMTKFIEHVYNQVQSASPQKDFKTFLRYFKHLITDPIVQSYAGVHDYELEDDTLVTTFMKKATDWGVYTEIVTLPHNSWMRSFEATAGYAARMCQNKREKARLS